MSAEKTLYLIDAYALIYRAYYAFIRAPRVNSRGLNTSAIFGFTNSLFDVLNRPDSTHVAVAFDPSGDTFRTGQFADYKANRLEMPDDIRISIPYIREIIKAFNIPILEMPGYEADDVIGTIAKQAESAGYKVYMVTPDKDYGQLVSENIFMFKPGRQGGDIQILGTKEICERYGIKNPLQVIDILGLMGDAVDNIPGIPGIGEKTAIKLIGEFESVENLLENTSLLKGKLKERVEGNKENALLSKQLATIITDVPVEFHEKELEIEKPNTDKLREIFSNLEFRSLTQRILGEKVQAVAGGEQMDMFSTGEAGEGVVTEMKSYKAEEKKYNLIETKDGRQNLIRTLLKQKEICFDTETTSVDAHNCELVGVSFSYKPNEAYYIPIPENRNAALFILEELKPVFSDKKILKTGHNLKYDIEVLSWYNLETEGPFFDTMLAHYLLQPELSHKMDYLAETYLNYSPISIETLIGKKGKGQKNMREIPVSEVAIYAGEDADITLQLKNYFLPKLKAEGLLDLFNQIEMPLMPVLADMETTGVNLDLPMLKTISDKMEGEIQELEKRICEQAGCEFNISSPKQLGEILFEKLNLGTKIKKTKTGQYSTNEETLRQLLHLHPIIGDLLEFRELKKLKSTYIDALPTLVNEKDKRIHTTYMQAIAATGRLSSQNPNLQNIPIRTERGREIRKAFIARDKNHKLLAADYSQIELRIIAELSGDEAMVNAFIAGEDIHAATASRVFDIPIGDVTREMRNKAKMVNFGIIYGISAFGLSQRLDIPRREAADLINQYFIKYPGIKAFMDEAIVKARENGYVETIMKRRRYLRDINSGNAVVRGFAERNAINAPIQGSAADMIKKAMTDIFFAFKENGIKAKMVLQVHDELIFDSPIEELEIIRPIIEDKMKNAVPMRVPLQVDIGVGDNWLEAH